MNLIVPKKKLLFIIAGGLGLVFMGIILGFKVLPKVVEKKVWEVGTLGKTFLKLFKNI